MSPGQLVTGTPLMILAVGDDSAAVHLERAVGLVLAAPDGAEGRVLVAAAGYVGTACSCPDCLRPCGPADNATRCTVGDVTSDGNVDCGRT